MIFFHTNNYKTQTTKSQAQQAFRPFCLRLKFWYFYRRKRLTKCLEILEQQGIRGELAISYLQGWGGGHHA